MPAAEAQDSRPNVPPASQGGGELVVGATSVVRTPTRRRAAKATSALRPQEIGASSSSVPDAEATSSVPMEWLHGGGMGTLIKAAQDIQADFRAEAATL